MEPQLQDARISFAEFSSLAHVRRHLHRLAFAIEFSQRIGRPVERQDFAKLTQRLVGVKLTPNVVDILFAVCADGEGKLDGHAFVKLMRARERMPGRKASHFAEQGELGPVSRLFVCFKDCILDPDERVDQPEDD
ncbi:hypothetical protein MNEG_8424 [Monoraphidium neglectum]|uniref:EF-hand domain-containing protein n=1 Tax=Monoraphidium neglectum TaxID=145388 RepID=A0A0D2MFR3_9CHLO|nr:hypothetical protein MNEG_8424 [Monoraphidium neglectum]KIY99536.1 hypothetical protein MNEG_8424 [Monoraphidium neglectum]|eukprot:XP_013898556.1 hypothetical protein MNEG_8424 [Monoraphidium neglectum]